MVISKSLLRSVGLGFSVALLMSSSACVFSRSVNKDFALSPEGEVTDGADAIVDGGNDTVAEGDVGSDETITPTSPTTPAQEEPASEPTTGGTPPVVTPAPASDICHRIAYSSREDKLHNPIIVGDDCIDGEKIKILQDLTADESVDYYNEAPTFSADGQSVTTYFTSWIVGRTETIKNRLSIWNIETGFPLLKDSIDGDRDGDGITDSLLLNLQQDPINDGGQLNLRASMPVCGNGVIEGFEVCDDGNQIDTDTCANTCQPTGAHTIPSTPKFMKSLFYTKKSGGAGGLYVLKKIVEQEASVGQAAFTREGSVIFSGAILGDAESNLYAFDLEAATASPVRIPGLSEAGVMEDQPAVSPDGSKVIYNRNSEIWTCDLVFTRLLPSNGQTTNEKGYHCIHQTKISNGIFDGVRNSSPCFSHDGLYAFFLSRAAHGANGQEHDAEVWRVNADGTNPVNVTDNDTDENALSCSPAAGPTGVLK